MKSKSKIGKQLKKKSNPELVETIKIAKKNSAWLEVAAALSGSRKNLFNINVGELNKFDGKENLVVAGKVLSMGEINKKLKIVALNFSEKAKEKLLKAGSDVSSILDEIKKNPGAKGIKVLK